MIPDQAGQVWPGLVAVPAKRRRHPAVPPYSCVLPGAVGAMSLRRVQRG
ncbi:hypothetical protein C882_2890 [Caenispirillum salinarum AK4]|uniref:Uncharacterized protein n=1 Tax=Caenispirillum salinarum AK4 TaxID=1238182 RepID=K9GM55_9PROT|nr:hypothetical protein C882_2890 [Caenispirillum salinarum AK4]